MSSARFLLHSNQFSERGDSVDLITMNRGLHDYLGIESIIAFPASDPRTSSSRVSEARALGIEVFEYNTRAELESLVKKERLTHNYVFSGGDPSGLSYCTSENPHWRLLETIHITRVVFRNYKPHGDFYLYVSEWLFDWSQKFPRSLAAAPKETVVSWLPHAVEPQVGDGTSFRISHDIPLDAKLVGRIGGFDQFDDPAARKAVLELLTTREDVWFAAVNTQNFGSHDRLIYIPEIDRNEVWDFYDACDLLLNGRLMGESFGFSIVEPLSIGKAVLAPSRSRNPFMDQHHLALLAPLGLLYDSKDQLLRLMRQALAQQNDGSHYLEQTKDFRLISVISKFTNLIRL